MSERARSVAKDMQRIMELAAAVDAQRAAAAHAQRTPSAGGVWSVDAQTTKESSAASTTEGMTAIFWKQADSAAAQATAAAEEEHRNKKAYAAAWARLGGRFDSLAATLRDPEFRDASHKDVHEFHARLKGEEAARLRARQDEANRILAVRAAAREPVFDEEARADFGFREQKFTELLGMCDGNVLSLSDSTIEKYRWALALAPADDRSYMAYNWCCVAHQCLAARATGVYVVGQKRLLYIASTIFGVKPPCPRTVKTAIIEGRTEPLYSSRSACPRDVMSVLHKFFVACRRVKMVCLKITIIDYFMRLLAGTKASRGCWPLPPRTPPPRTPPPRAPSRASHAASCTATSCAIARRFGSPSSHPPTYSPTYLLTYSPTHLLTQPPTHPTTYSPTTCSMHDSCVPFPQLNLPRWSTARLCGPATEASSGTQKSWTIGTIEDGSKTLKEAPAINVRWTCSEQSGNPLPTCSHTTKASWMLLVRLAS